MTAEPRQIKCAIYRGGTSRGVLFKEESLPASPAVRARILTEIFGSPHPRQIDGLGGGTSVTSKAMIVGPSQKPDADIQMLFGQVSITSAMVDWGGICGNLTTAVGPFAIDQGLVPAVEPFTNIRVYSINSRKIINVRVPVHRGRVDTEGSYEIAGVPGKGARISMEYLEPAGSYNGKLLPTGKPRETIELEDGRSFTVSMVDAGNVVVFCIPKELGLRGDELPVELEARPDILATLEGIRSAAAERLGIVESRSDATAKSPGFPKIGFVSAVRDYQTNAGRHIRADEIDILGRLMTMQSPHHSYMGGGAIATGAAAMIDGTVVQEVCHLRLSGSETLRIGHPSGIMEVSVKAERQNGEAHIRSVTIYRTARRIMEGVAFVSESSFAEAAQ